MQTLNLRVYKVTPRGQGGAYVKCTMSMGKDFKTQEWNPSMWWDLYFSTDVPGGFPTQEGTNITAQGYPNGQREYQGNLTYGFNVKQWSAQVAPPQHTGYGVQGYNQNDVVPF